MIMIYLLPPTVQRPEATISQSRPLLPRINLTDSELMTMAVGHNECLLKENMMSKSLMIFKAFTPESWSQPRTMFQYSALGVEIKWNPCYPYLSSKIFRLISITTPATRLNFSSNALSGSY